jgi:hypothetical protein
MLKAPVEVSTSTVFCNVVFIYVGGTPADRATSAVPNAGEFSPITVKIEYSMHKPFDGVEFVIPTDAYPHVRRSGSVTASALINSYTACSPCIYYTLLSGRCPMLGTLSGQHGR